MHTEKANICTETFETVREDILGEFHRWVESEADNIRDWWIQRFDDGEPAPTEREIDEQIDLATDGCYWVAHTEVYHLLAVALLLETDSRGVGSVRKLPLDDAPEHIYEPGHAKDPSDYLKAIVEWRLMAEMRSEVRSVLSAAAAERKVAMQTDDDPAMDYVDPAYNTRDGAAQEPQQSDTPAEVETCASSWAAVVSGCLVNGGRKGADRLVGIPADLLMVDEFQDVLTSPDES